MIHRKRALILALTFPCTLFLALPALADDSGPARLVGNFATDSVETPQALSGFASIGGRSVFLRFDNELYPALWVTDGTAEGTHALGVLCPPCESASLLGSTGSVAFYRVFSSIPKLRMRIWRTDGTPTGTFPVTGEQLLPAEGPNGQGSPSVSTIAGGRLYFTAYTTGTGCELWSSNGSVQGTAPVGEVTPGPESGGIRELAAAGERVFLIAGAVDGPSALWLADGTGLHFLREAPRAQGLSTGVGRVFFIAEDDGLEVWTSNGTAAGTRPLTQFALRNPFELGTFLKILDGRLYFMAKNRGQGRELWSVGVQPHSLRRLSDFADRLASVSDVGSGANRIVFVTQRGPNQPSLWSSRWDFRSTMPLSGCPGGCPSVVSELIAVGPGQLAFYGNDTRGGGFWRTDGTAEGTRLLRRTATPRSLVQTAKAGGLVLFEITDEYETGELWVTDGSAGGTLRATTGGPSWSTDGYASSPSAQPTAQSCFPGAPASPSKRCSGAAPARRPARGPSATPRWKEAPTHNGSCPSGTAC